MCCNQCCKCHHMLNRFMIISGLLSRLRRLCSSPWHLLPPDHLQTIFTMSASASCSAHRHAEPQAHELVTIAYLSQFLSHLDESFVERVQVHTACHSAFFKACHSPLGSTCNHQMITRYESIRLARRSNLEVQRRLSAPFALTLWMHLQVCLLRLPSSSLWLYLSMLQLMAGCCLAIIATSDKMRPSVLLAMHRRGGKQHQTLLPNM